MNQELARRLCAALISTRMGIGMDYALAKYVTNAGNEKYWLDLADKIERDLVENLEKSFAPQSASKANRPPKATE